ncbi:hypothetical protein CF319_g7684 [Tilletia indica]|uniref:Uncharacterized protein n=1 Tax=Tilletia indica TaxID=43049 RepID=A0A177T5B7_9BASI|nr:hypothetical protein CF319_g7684 [Tilletia indica]KAE8242691.1 hypothetical protein A4X13_0g7050 [Tilletia indica]
MTPLNTDFYPEYDSNLPLSPRITPAQLPDNEDLSEYESPSPAPSTSTHSQTTSVTTLSSSKPNDTIIHDKTSTAPAINEIKTPALPTNSNDLEQIKSADLSKLVNVASQVETLLPILQRLGEQVPLINRTLSTRLESLEDHQHRTLRQNRFTLSSQLSSQDSQSSTSSARSRDRSLF